MNAEDETVAIMHAAILMAGDSDPKEYLSKARSLLIAANSHVLDCRDREDEYDYNVKIYEDACKRRAEQLEFTPDTDWDELREYLNSKGKRMQKAGTVRRNMREFYTQTNRPRCVKGINDEIRKRGRALIPISDIDDLIRRKKQAQSAGGLKGHNTRKKQAKE
jgi:hypothetical protein